MLWNGLTDSEMFQFHINTKHVTTGANSSLKLNKTVTYHWHVFHSPILREMLFERMKTFHLQKMLVTQFLIFLNFTLLICFDKEIHNWGGKDIVKQWCHLIGILLQICQLHRLSKKIIFFSKKNTNFKRIWEILLLPSHSAVNLRKFGSIIFQIQNWAFCQDKWQVHCRKICPQLD